MIVESSLAVLKSHIMYTLVLFIAIKAVEPQHHKINYQKHTQISSFCSESVC